MGAVLCALVAGPIPATADRLVVYGPAGSGTERRALAVIERDDGACAPWQDFAVSGEEAGVEVNQRPVDGSACARWLDITADPARTSVTLAIQSGPSAGTRAAVAMGGDQGLRLRATRAGLGVRVGVGGAPAADTVVTATWAGGDTTLAPSGASDFAGPAPPDELVGIVARSGDLVSAAALPPAALAHGSRVLVLPSALAVPGGGAVRTAAFLVVTDRRGRLSSTVPLHVTSERGRLRRMTWISPGVASVALTADAGVSSVDLRAWTEQEAEARSIEIPVQSDWPIRATIDAPAFVERGRELRVRASVTLLGGTVATGAAGLEIRCDETAATRDADGSFRCTPGGEREATVVATVLVDGRAVPLAQQQVEVRAAPPAPVVPVVRPVPRPRPRAPVAHRVAPLASLAAGVSSAGDVAWGAGVGAEWSAARRLRLTATARYEGSSVDAAGVNVVRDDLVGTRHGAELLFGAAVRIRDDRTSFVAGAAVGPSWVWSDLHVGTAGESSSAVRLVGRVSSGPRTRLGSLELGLDLGLRLVPISSERTWHEPLATAYLEINGAMDAR